MPFNLTSVFASSGSFVIPAGVYKLRVWVLGGGGSGAAAASSYGGATGGGGGGFALKTLNVTPGNTLTVTIGAGGNGVSITTNTGGNGNSGGASSVSGSGFTTITANGGAGGVWGTSGSKSGGAGGTASGGDINATGGDGGDITTVNSYSNKATGGGGSGSYLGDGGRGGDITATHTATHSNATGGGSIGGFHGGDCTTDLTNTSGGASCCSNGTDNANTAKANGFGTISAGAGANNSYVWTDIGSVWFNYQTLPLNTLYLGICSQPCGYPHVNPLAGFYAPSLASTPWVTPGTYYFGGSGGAVSGTSYISWSYTTPSCYSSGQCAGGGGSVFYNGSTDGAAYGPYAGRGAGSGGVFCDWYSASGTATSRAGGSGLVVIEY